MHDTVLTGNESYLNHCPDKDDCLLIRNKFECMSKFRDENKINKNMQGILWPSLNSIIGVPFQLIKVNMIFFPQMNGLKVKVVKIVIKSVVNMADNAVLINSRK